MYFASKAKSPAFAGLFAYTSIHEWIPETQFYLKSGPDEKRIDSCIAACECNLSAVLTFIENKDTTEVFALQAF